MVDKINPAAGPRELLAQLCTERGEDYAALSRLIGRNSAYVQQFIRRGTPRRLPERERRILARHFGISERLLGADEERAGARDFAVPEALEGREDATVAFAPEWLSAVASAGAEDLRRFRVSGEAMAPTLTAGDELLVDLADGSARLRDGLYLLRFDEMLQVRRMTLHPARRQVTVQCDNPAYPDWPGLVPEEIEVVGRLVWTGRRLT